MEKLNSDFNMTVSSMKAVKIISKGRVNIIDTNVPKPASGRALVQPLLLAICGTDLCNIFYLPDSEYPLAAGISGHEVIGRIVHLNNNQNDHEDDILKYPGGPVEEGDIVLTLVPEYENAMAEFVTTKIENLLPIPKNIPPTHSVLAQQLGTVIFACKRLPNIVGKNVVVIGQGSAGLFFNVMLRRLGAKKVIGFDLSDARVSMGLSFGATACFNSRRINPIEAVSKAIGAQMADIVIEAVGEPETINLTSKLVKKRGDILFFGVPHESNFSFDYMSWYHKCVNSISVVGADEDPGKCCFFQALDLISSGEVIVAPMMTHTFMFPEVGKAYEYAHTREDGAGKVFIKMPSYDEFFKD